MKDILARIHRVWLALFCRNSIARNLQILEEEISALEDDLYFPRKSHYHYCVDDDDVERVDEVLRERESKIEDLRIEADQLRQILEF